MHDDIPVPNVQWKTPDDGQRNCPKHAEFLDKNKFGKIRASVGFIKKKFVTMHGHMNVKKKVLTVTNEKINNSKPHKSLVFNFKTRHPRWS
jgi:hypothetical protein